VGAVLVENEHHKEIFIREIKLVTGGDSSTAVTFDCNSWVHSKFDKPEKRIFFTLKVFSCFSMHAWRLLQERRRTYHAWH